MAEDDFYRKIADRYMLGMGYGEQPIWCTSTKIKNIAFLTGAAASGKSRALRNEAIAEKLIKSNH